MMRLAPGNALLIALGALGLWLGFPSPLPHMPPLALLYPAALCLLGLRAASRGEALRLGWLTGLAGASAALYWLALPVHEVGGLPWPLAAPCALAIGAYVGIYGGLFSLCAHTLTSPPETTRSDTGVPSPAAPLRTPERAEKRALRHDDLPVKKERAFLPDAVLRPRSPLATGLALGIIWYFLELLRGTLFTGFPWLSLATAFAPWPVMIQGAWLAGAYALGGILAAAACLLALGGAWRPRGAARPSFMPRKQRMAALLAGLLLLALPAGFGLWRLHGDTPASAACGDATSPAPPADAFSVIMVEGNIDQNQKWEQSLQQSTVDLYLRLSREALAAWRAGQRAHVPTGRESSAGQSLENAHGAARQAAPVGGAAQPPLLIWPETAMPFYFQAHPVYGPQVMNFAREEHVPLLLGAPGVLRQSRDEYQIFNRAYLIRPGGSVADFYDKTHLVPFGEYLPPWLAFDFLKPLLQGVGDFTPGVAYAPLRTGDLALGMLICYESIFPEVARQRVKDGANVLVNISNDGWFGDSAAPEQHLQLAVLRAVEQQRWLVRSTNTGISAIVDDRGRTVLRGGQFKAQSLQGCARRVQSLSPFYHISPWLPYAAALLLLALLCLPLPRR